MEIFIGILMAASITVMVIAFIFMLIQGVRLGVENVEDSSSFSVANEVQRYAFLIYALCLNTLILFFGDLVGGWTFALATLVNFMAYNDFKDEIAKYGGKALSAIGIKVKLTKK